MIHQRKVPPEQFSNLPEFLEKYPEAGIAYLFGLIYAIIPEKRKENCYMTLDGIQYFQEYVKILRENYLNLNHILKLNNENFFNLLQKLEIYLDLTEKNYLDQQKIYSNIEKLEFDILNIISNDPECCIMYVWFSISQNQ